MSSKIEDLISEEDVAVHLGLHVSFFRSGIESYYPEPRLLFKEGAGEFGEDIFRRAMDTAIALKIKGHPTEACVMLSLLALYDIFILAGNNPSMGYAEEGVRRETLEQLIQVIADVYEPASLNGEGLTGLYFYSGCNSGPIPTGHEKVKPAEIPGIMSTTDYCAFPTIGLALDKIMNKHCFGGKYLRRPMIMLVLTDSDAGCEPFDYVTDVVGSEAILLVNNAGKEFHDQNVSFQFAKIGDDFSVNKFLERMKQECLPMAADTIYADLTYLKSNPDMAVILSKLLLGCTLNPTNHPSGSEHPALAIPNKIHSFINAQYTSTQHMGPRKPINEWDNTSNHGSDAGGNNASAPHSTYSSANNSRKSSVASLANSLASRRPSVASIASVASGSSVGSGRSGIAHSHTAASIKSTASACSSKVASSVRSWASKKG